MARLRMRTALRWWARSGAARGVSERLHPNAAPLSRVPTSGNVPLVRSRNFQCIHGCLDTHCSAYPESFWTPKATLSPYSQQPGHAPCYGPKVNSGARNDAASVWPDQESADPGRPAARPPTARPPTAPPLDGQSRPTPSRSSAPSPSLRLSIAPSPTPRRSSEPSPSPSPSRPPSPSLSLRLPIALRSRSTGLAARRRSPTPSRTGTSRP
jgi:hypothetical protein